MIARKTSMLAMDDSAKISGLKFQRTTHLAMDGRVDMAPSIFKEMCRPLSEGT